MQKKIADTTASADTVLGGPTGRKLFKIPSGQYCGRLAALIRTSPTDIRLTFADPPFVAWSSPQLVANDAAEQKFDAVMDSSGNIHVVYPEASTQYLVTRKLTFAGGLWSIGPKVTIFNGDPGYDPSISVEPGGKLWVCWSRFSSPNRLIHAKSSNDSGGTWGAGPSDAGDALSSPSLSSYSRLLVGANDIHVIYTYGNAGLAIRSCPIGGGSWSSEEFIATGNSGFTEQFDAAIRPDGLLAVVYNDTMFRYREFDGVTWGAIITLDALPQTSPQLLFRNNSPVVVYTTGLSGVQKLLTYTQRQPGGFSAAAMLDNRAKPFDTVLLYSQTSASYANVTAAAESATTGDVFHPATNALLKNAGDAVYLGMDRPFRYAQFTLSAPGAGGTVTYSFWDGVHWQAFTPVNGASYFDAADVQLLFWNDYADLPHDWQRKTVDGVSLFWIKIEVVSSYATGPVGSQVTAVSELQHVSFRR